MKFSTESFFTQVDMFSTSICLCLVILSSFSYTNGENKIPHFLKICKRNDPNLNECIKESVEQIKPYLGKGIPELMIPSCNPLKLKDDINIDLFTGSNFIKISYKNVSVFDATNFDLKSVNLNLNKGSLILNLSIPTLETIGNLEVLGKIAGIPILGNGTSQGKYANITAEAILKFDKFQQNRHEYLRVSDVDVKIDVGSVRFGLKNVFRGQIGEIMDEFLSQNGHTIAEDVKPVLQETIGMMFKKLCNRMFSAFTIEQLLPHK